MSLEQLRHHRSVVDGLAKRSEELMAVIVKQGSSDEWTTKLVATLMDQHHRACRELGQMEVTGAVPQDTKPVSDILRRSPSK